MTKLNYVMSQSEEAREIGKEELVKDHCAGDFVEGHFNVFSCLCEVDQATTEEEAQAICKKCWNEEA